MGSKAKNWKDLSGQRNWEGLLDPLHIDLRRYIIHYGERAEAVADAFNGQAISKGYGKSRYPMEGFFSYVGLENGNPYKYKVTSFIYAKSEIKTLNWVHGESSWIAYVAVATDEGKAELGRRDILISWRGTKTDLEKLEDLDLLPVSASDILGKANDPKVHKGFLSVYTANDSNSIYNKSSAREQVIKEVKKLVEKYKNEEVSITVTGHCMGAAVATLNAVDIAANGHNKPTGQPDKAFPVTAIVFASPRTGDEGFRQVFEGLKDDLHVLRISNSHDPVPKLPVGFGYVHVGEELEIDSTKSPYLKDGNKCKLVHELEVYLHGVAGTQGSEKEFEFAIDRDISLVNKTTDGLKDEFQVPDHWWIENNKSMIQEDDGSWKLDDYVPDPPSP